MNPARRFGFPGDLRLKQRRLFLLLYERGLRVPAEHLVLFAMPNAFDHPRLGLTATKKVGNAVERNRARRLVREAFRRHRELFGNWDIVINVRSSAVGRTSREIEEDVLRLARRTRRLAARGALEGRA